MFPEKKLRSRVEIFRHTYDDRVDASWLYIRLNTHRSTVMPQLHYFDLLSILCTTRAVLTNGHTGHVPKAPGFFFFLRGPQPAVVKYFLNELLSYC